MSPPEWPAQEYLRFRPTYPASLFRHLAELGPGRDLAWDCATGNGQAAVDLAREFSRVVATDRDPAQVAAAIPRDNVTYRVSPADDSGLEAGAVDLVTVACGVHWFADSGFFAEAVRVLRPGGVLAVWTYDGRPRVTPEVDAIVDELYDVRLADAFPPGFEHVRARYRDLPFPLPDLTVPDFTATADWTADELLGHLRSWSGARRHRDRTGVDLVTETEAAVRAAWPGAPDERRRVSWPLYFRVGRKTP